MRIVLLPLLLLMAYEALLMMHCTLMTRCAVLQPLSLKTLPLGQMRERTWPKDPGLLRQLRATFAPASAWFLDPISPPVLGAPR